MWPGARVRGVRRLAAVVAILLTAGLVSTPAVGASPAMSGTVAVADYDLGDTALTDPQTGTVSEVRAEVYYPRLLAGRRPLIVMSHGSWWACDVQTAATWPCPPGSHAFPSYLGYAYLGKALAAQGSSWCRSARTG